MVYLMCRSKSHQVVKVMGHDVKQFKSLEGYLESGPQFVLQSYILLRGMKIYSKKNQHQSQKDIGFDGMKMTYHFRQKTRLRRSR